MIKAKKGLLIALFAAMMVFAFGATSAFAADAQKVVWSDDFKSADVYVTGQENPTHVNATLAFATTGVNAGVTTATIAIEGVTIEDNTRYFFDLTGATIKGTDVSNVFSESAYKRFAADHQQLGDAVYVELKKPEGATGEDTYAIKNAQRYFNNFRWQINFAVDGDVVVPATAAPITAVFTGTRVTEKDGLTPDYAARVGADPVINVQVVADPLLEGVWYKDGTSTVIGGSPVENYNPQYDGAEHTATVVNKPDYTIQYQKYNNSTGLWENIDGNKVTWKDATDTAAYYRAAYLPAVAGAAIITPAQYPTLTIIGVRPYNVLPTVAWAPENVWSLVDPVGGQYHVTPEQAKDPSAFLVFGNDLGADVDMDAIKAYFNDRYEVTVTPTVADANKQVWKITDKGLSADLQKKHATLIGNYYIDTTHNLVNPGMTVTAPDSVKVVVNSDIVDPNTNADFVHIDFAPTAKTYHVKKAKKLKANKSFTVEATSKSGNAITYLLKTPNKKIKIDSATGKVTVKKGLKKGTYKIKVTARTEGGNGFAPAQDVANITIKIKK